MPSKAIRLTGFFFKNNILLEKKHVQKKHQLSLLNVYLGLRGDLLF